MTQRTLPLSEIAVPSALCSARSNQSELKEQPKGMVLDRWLVKPNGAEDCENENDPKVRVSGSLATPKPIGILDAVPCSILKKTPRSQSRSSVSSSVKRFKKPATPASTNAGKEGNKSTGLFKFFKPVEGSSSIRRRTSVSVIIEPSAKKLKDNRGLSASVGTSTPTPLSRSGNLMVDGDDDDEDVTVETIPPKKVFKQCCLSFGPATSNMDQNKETSTSEGQSVDGSDVASTQKKPRFEFTFDTKVKRSTVMDDLDDRVLVASNPLPELTLLKPRSGCFSMPKLADLAMVHEFIHVFSGELLDFAFVSPEGDALSLDCLEKMIMDQDGFHVALANLHCALLAYVYEDDENDSPNIDATNFQYYLAETLRNTECHALLETTEYPLLSPEDRLKVLSQLLEKVLWTRSFSHHMKELNLRRAEMQKERQQRRDARRDLEIDLGDVERGCEELEREIEEVEMQENGDFFDADAKIQSGDDEGEDSKNDEVKSRISSRRATLERAKVQAEITDQFRERRTLLAKQLVKRRKNLKEKQTELEELEEREKGFDAEKETLSSQMRGGAVVGQSISTSELVHLGYDRWARGYWHWRSVGGIFLEDYDEYHGLGIPKKDRTAGNDGAEDQANPTHTDMNVSPNAPGPTTQASGTKSLKIADAKKLRKWWCIRDVATFREFFRALNTKGSRERVLKANISQIRSEIEKTFPKFSEWLDRRQVLAFVDHSTAPTPLSPSSLVQTTLPISESPVASKVIDPQRMSLGKYVQEYSSAVREKISRLHQMADEYGGYELEQLGDSELPPVPTPDVQDASSLAQHLRSVISCMSQFPGATTGNPLGVLRERENEIEKKCKMGSLPAINVWLQDLLETMEKVDREKRLREEEEARKEKRKTLRTKGCNDKGKGKESTSGRRKVPERKEHSEEDGASTSRKSRQGNGRNNNIQEEPARKRPMRAAAVLAGERTTRLAEKRKVNSADVREEEAEELPERRSGRNRKADSAESKNAEDESFENPGSSSEADEAMDELADTYEVESEEDFRTRRLRERQRERPTLSRAERAAARMEQKEREETKEDMSGGSEDETAVVRTGGLQSFLSDRLSFFLSHSS